MTSPASRSRGGPAAKGRGSRHQPARRSPDWRKIKLTKTQDCVILGWTPGQGGRTRTFGSLLVGALVGDELRWIGQGGTGFTDTMLERLLTQAQPPGGEAPPRRRHPPPPGRRARGA